MPKIAANGTQLYYELSGQGSTLLFIHGLGSSTRDWEYQVPEFSRSYQVLTFDLRGHGQSDKPDAPYNIPMFAADVEGLFQAVGVQSAHIVGLSLGGCVAFQFALDHPTRVKTLTIVNSAPGVGPAEQAQKEVDRRVGIVEQFGMRGMGEALSANLFPKPEHASLRQTFVERWVENDPVAYVAATRALLNWDVTDRLDSIQCPTLIVAADHDYSPVAVKEAYARLIARAELAIIADAHHAVPLECAREFNAVLGNFLARHR